MAGLSGGGFIGVWPDDGSEDSIGNGLRGQVYAADGSTVGNEFTVSTDTDGVPRTPAVTGLSGEQSVAVWAALTQTVDGARPAIHVQVLNADGSKSGAEFKIVGSDENDLRETPDVAALQGGGFAVTWQDGGRVSGGVLSRSSVMVQLFDADGDAIGDEVLVAAPNSYYGFSSPAIAPLDDGSFVITFYDQTRYGPDKSESAISAQIFDADGNLSGDRIYVNSTFHGTQTAPAVEGMDNGAFVVSWTDDTVSGSANKPGIAILAQAFANDGTRIDDEFVVNDPGTGTETFSNGGLTQTSDGVFVASFGSGPLRGDIVSHGNGSAKVFKFGMPLMGDNSDNVLNGTLFGDEIHGLGGDDTIQGKDGDDRLFGGDGNDMIVADNGDNLLRGGDGDDEIIAGKDNNRLYGMTATTR